MSAVQVSEYKPHDQASLEAEREQILRTASRKAKDKTLTLEETNDLFTKFNDTYSARLKAKKERLLTEKDDIDESWALKLLKDCEEEDVKHPHAQNAVSFQSSYIFKNSYNLARNHTSDIKASPCTDEQVIIVSEQAKIPQADLLDNLNRYQPLDEYSVEFRQENSTKLKIAIGLALLSALSFALTLSWLLQTS